MAACTKAFAAHDAQVTDERYNLLNAWLAVLPGNAAYNLRSMHLLNTNYADLSLLFAQDARAPTNAHLGREVARRRSRRRRARPTTSIST